MKKNYITPEIEVVRFDTEDVLAASQLLQPEKGSENAPVANGGFSFEGNSFKVF